jgi:phosphoribosylamine--glycine ligase
MKVLVVGSGAREHAIAWALVGGRDFGNSPRTGVRVFCAPGNAGTAAVARNIAANPEDATSIVAACRELGIDLAIVGPERPLAAGIVDALTTAGFLAFGPSRAAAVLESSKSLARAFSMRYGVPCAGTATFRNRPAFERFLVENRGKRIVLKKSGLAAGKGVFESDDAGELTAFGTMVLETDELLAEEFLAGRELSIFALCDHGDFLLLPACADHKKAEAGDLGPNTGGMGAVCPIPFADKALMDRIEREIVSPTFRGMEIEGLDYRGVLFFGIMVTDGGPRLLEYNVRFGDPETQSLLPLLEMEILDLFSSVVSGRLRTLRIPQATRHACGVVLAAPGYPGPYPKGLAVEILEVEAVTSIGRSDTAFLFHADTSKDAAGQLRTGGGRCFTAVGVGRAWEQARDEAYRLASTVRFTGAWYRPDIGAAVHARQ